MWIVDLKPGILVLPGKKMILGWKTINNMC